MSIEGLDFILKKQEVIPTVSASDLVTMPSRVEDNYNRHVRTYVPINRAAEGQAGTLNVDQFESRVIKAVKDAKAPRGYLTAEYGYGKTSTALYLWKRAEEANLVVVPPFQMLHLPDLVTAIHGWVRYRLGVHSPQLVSELDQLYEDTTNRGIEQDAERLKIGLQQLEELRREGRYILELQPADYIRYFEQATAIVREAGFDGLLVLADEIQQYIEPRVKTSSEPIAPLFNLIQMLLTREGYLNFGLILIIGLKEVGLIRETRNDLLHRMRQLSLDLTNVYDREFASRLWNVLAKEFDFRDVAADIVTPEALESLGEVASRTDLSDGPRTVVNTFRRMVERYKTYGVSTPPYTPIDLIDDLIGGAIQFAGNNQIQNVTRRALQSAIVQNNPERFENAVKLAAAYPVSGVPFRTQKKLGLDQPLEELMRLAIGEIVISVGLPEERGVTLFGLHEGVQKTDWLSQTVRDFRRAYGEHHEATRDRAINMFTKIVKQSIFKNWTVVEERKSTFTSNRSIILQGDFQSFTARYPRRQVHVRILWEEEERKDATISGDVAVEYRLSIHSELQDDPDQRREFAEPASVDYENHTAIIPINLMYVRSEGIPPQIVHQLEGVWSPYDLSPLVLMNIYEMLEEKRDAKLIPQQDDQFIANGFQPDLLHNAVRDLFNSKVGANLGGVSEGRITEVAVEQLLDNRYLDTYKTIMAQTNWSSWITKYSNAIAQLDNLYQKRGEVEVEGTKEEIAKLLASSNAALDNFIRTFGLFLSVERDWKGGSVGAVRFTLHDLEAKILEWLRSSTAIERIAIGGKSVEVHAMNASDVYEKSRRLGYQDDEIEQLLNLLERRELIEFFQKHRIREVPSQTVNLDIVAAQIREFSQDVEALLEGFPDNKQVLARRQDAENWQAALERERQSGTPDPQRVHRLSRNIQLRQEELREFAQEKQKEILQQLSLLQRNLQPINQQKLDFLNNPILGHCEYERQVNVLRVQLLNLATSVKAEVDRTHNKLEQLQAALRQEDIPYEGIARSATESRQLHTQLQGINDRLRSFDEMYRHLLDWQRLVNDGSSLLDQMQQMSHLTQDQQAQFDQLIRDIRADISSRGNKLEALPAHSVYAAPLGKLIEEVSSIRRSAEDGFINLQNRYYQLFTANKLYSREQIGRSFEYNIANPDESYRLLHERVQKLACDLHHQISRVVDERRQEVLTILRTPFLDSLVDERKSTIEEEGKQLLELADSTLEALGKMSASLNDISVIRDFPEEGEGQFHQVVAHLLEAYEISKDLTLRSKQLSNWLTQIALTPEEQNLLDHLHTSDGDKPADIYDWLDNSKTHPDEFWRVLRGLYEKHRVRVLISRVRR